MIGDPIEQSLSPAIHNAAFRHLGLNKVMVPFLVPDGELETFFKELLWLDIKGCSVTIPHKEAIVPLAPAEGRGRRANRDVQHGGLRGGRPAGRLQHRLSRGDGFARDRPWAAAKATRKPSPLFDKQVLILGQGEWPGRSPSA